MKRKTIEVMNASTGETQLFCDMLPSEAVHAAYLQAKGNRNTWDYRRLYLEDYDKLVFGDKTVALGDFIALR